MENRKNLHDYGLVLVILGILDLFMFVSTIVASLIDGTITKVIATAEPDIIVAVKVILGLVVGLMGLIVLADVFIGIKALKVSKNPNADKGYITAAKVFFVMSVIASISHIVTLFNGSVSVVDTVLNLVSAVLGAVVYFLFVKAAQAVRRDVLNGEK